MIINQTNRISNKDYKIKKENTEYVLERRPLEEKEYRKMNMISFKRSLIKLQRDYTVEVKK